MMTHFEELLLEGGKTNSLGKTDEVIATVLGNQSLLDDLYACMLSQDPWVRMRAADGFEKVCRVHPEWIEPHIDTMQSELSDDSQQASIQWHLAQIYQQVQLSSDQKQNAITWLKHILSSSNIDWIVSANAMATLTYFAKSKDITSSEVLPFLSIQLQHTSAAVIKKAMKYIDELS